MGSRDRDAKSLQEKLKQYFKKSVNAPPPPKNELVMTPDLERELSSDTLLHRRLKAIKELNDKVLNNRLQSSGVERLWSATRDLLEDPSIEARHTALGLWGAVCRGQTDNLTMMRTELLQWLRNTHPTHCPDDSQHRFQLLTALTNNGKNITCFEGEIGAFLLEWMPQIQSPAHLVEFLELVTNVIKFNAAYLDETIVAGIVTNCCYVCSVSSSVAAVQCCMGTLVAVVSYSMFPPAALHEFVCALCHTVNVERYCQDSWKLMGFVLGADLGYAALSKLLEVLAGGAAAGDAGIARGAVFYINMALWGARRLPALRVSYLAVLPAFLMALEAAPSQHVVTYEVILAVQSLVSRCSNELDDVAYDVVYQILHEILNHIESYNPPNELISSRLHEVVTLLEQLVEKQQYNGTVSQLYDLVDRCGHSRPEASVIKLVNYKLNSLQAGSGNWLETAARVAERYSRHDTRLSVRLQVLHATHSFIQMHRALHEDELLERVSLPVLGAAAVDAAVPVRTAAARHLAELAARASSDACTDLLDLLEKIMNRPFEIYVTEMSLPAKTDMSDVRAALHGLLEVFHSKLCRLPSSHAVRVYLVLLNHVEQHYRRPGLFLHHPDLRLKILELFYSVRINSHYQVGFCYDSQGQSVSGELALQQRLKPTYSPYLCLDYRPNSGSQQTTKGVSYVSLGRASRIVSLVLTSEQDWSVLSATLRALPRLLQHRPLTGRHSDVDVLASTLCTMVSEKSVRFPECARAGSKLSQSEFHAAVLPLLASLAPHHHCLERQTQQRIIKCLLKYGIGLRSAAVCIGALTLFTLETRDTMVKMLPEVLLDLSKISDTTLIACPMLEFLSTLTRLPKVFASFVEDQYMSVFAILLPYTNPSRYNHYVVSLAHHVIAAWFLKCRLKYRRNFVKFIIKGLHNYIIVPFEEQLFRAHATGTANEDSSNRKRSSSLGSGMSRMLLAGARGPSSNAAFHLELTETCVDLLARYTFTPCSVKPQRSPTVEFLLSGGESRTWLVGHKLVTITTSGCLQNTLKQGLCDRCAVLCKQHIDNIQSPNPEPDENTHPEIKRYSKHSLQHSRSTETSGSSLSISDSLQPPLHSPLSTRQNSSENKSTASEAPSADAQAQLSLKLEHLAGQEGSGGGSRRWSRAGSLLGSCPCWCAGWAEVHVRSPTGDVSWVMKMQNQMSFEQLLESSLQDVSALLAPSLAPSSRAASSASSGLGDSRLDVTGDCSAPRSRSGSSSSQCPAPDLHKSSSDTVMTSEKKPPHAATHCIVPPQPQRSQTSTEPINIPGSPQRQSSSSTTDDDDTLLSMQDGKCRHPVRRSNSSPEMSSSWKASLPLAASPPPASPPPASPPPLDLDNMIVMPSCEPTSTSASLHASKKAHKKSELRVSCEAIPEEQAHPTLMTYNSDPGTAPAVSSDTALDVLSDRTTHHALQKVASDGSVASECAPRARPAPREELPPLSRSKRSNTISVMSPTRKRKEAVSPKRGSSGGAGGAGSAGGAGGVTPGFVLLQLYHNIGAAAHPVPGASSGAGSSWVERPLQVLGEQHERSIKNLDLVPPLETYKVGVLYVGVGQHDNETLILKNEYGSIRYGDFVRELGTLVELDGETPGLFVNLERGGKDGLYTYVWNDDIMQVHFHVATAMPCYERDPTCNEKRKYIGNDYVSIVYNDSGRDFNIHTIKGQLNFCIVVVEPQEHGICRVLVKSKDERVRNKFLPHLDSYLVSDLNVALLARQLALHCTLASLISRSLTAGSEAPYASNSLERLRIIKRLRSRLETERQEARDAAAPYNTRRHTLPMDDFTDYC